MTPKRLHKIRNYPENRKARIYGWFNKNCLMCKKEFKVRNCEKYKKFCCIRCAYDFRIGKSTVGIPWPEERKIRMSILKRGKPVSAERLVKLRANAEKKKKRVKYKCFYCGKDCELIPAHFNKRKNHFCSMKCSADYKRNVMKPWEFGAWKGGKSFEPYDLNWNNDLKESIRTRDKYRCQECFRHQSELKKKLDVHHIDYNKFNSVPENLISLCHSCHMQTNYKRKDWERYYKERLYGKS